MVSLVKTLLSSVINCVLQQDSHGYNALHVAARSKASGFARFFLRLFDDTKQQIRNPHDPRILDLLGLRLPQVIVGRGCFLSRSLIQCVLLQVTENGKLTFTVLTNAISARDMDMLLQVGETANRLEEMLHVKDRNGNTPLHLAVAAGRLELVR